MLAHELLVCLATEQPELVADAANLLRRIQPCRHGPDFACVVWFGTTYQFTATQSHVIKPLWEAWQNGTPDVRHETLLLAAGSEASNLRDVFRDHPAWNTMIVSKAKGTYRLTGQIPGCAPG